MEIQKALRTIIGADKEKISAIDSNLVQNQAEKIRSLYREKEGELQ